MLEREPQVLIAGSTEPREGCLCGERSQQVASERAKALLADGGEQGILVVEVTIHGGRRDPDAPRDLSQREVCRPPFQVDLARTLQDAVTGPWIVDHVNSVNHVTIDVKTGDEPEELRYADWMSEHKGSCFCGAVEITVSGEPAAMGYCHCESCRKWSAGPVNAFTLWAPANVKVVKGADLLVGHAKNPTSDRKWCKTCGGHVLTDHAPWSMVDVYAATIPSFAFKPALHVNYQETVLHIKDGLPKMKDMPKEMGGSGETLPE